MLNVKRTTIRAAATAGAADMAASGTFNLVGWGNPFKVLIDVICANAYVFSVTFRKLSSTGAVVGECVISSAATPGTFEYNFDPQEIKTIHWAVVGTAPAGTINLLVHVLEEHAKTK